MATTLRLGLIGAGRIGTVHARHLAHRLPEASLVMVADPVAEAARQCARQCNAPTALCDYRRVIEEPDVDAVVICSTTDTHAAIIEEAAAAGKHIFCEKPIARNLADIDRALEAVERAGVKLQVGFNRRFDANYRRASEAITRGEIGEPHLIHLVSRDPAPPSMDYVRASGGLFLDMTIHDFDMARFLIGKEVEEVFTMAAVRIEPALVEMGDFDTAVVMLKFESGVIGTIDNSRKAVYGYDQRVEVLGSEGSVQTNNVYPNEVQISDGQSVRRDVPLNFFMTRYTESFVTEMQAFVRAVLDDRPPPVTGEDGRAPVAMALAARTSYDEKRPVTLKEVDARNHG